MDGAAAFLSFQGKSSIRRTFIWVPSISRGREVIPANYRALSPFREGRALIVDREGRFGMIDRSGKVVIPASYDELGPFEKTVLPLPMISTGDLSTKPTRSSLKTALRR